MRVSHSTRQPSAKYLTAQSLFLEVNANQDKRLQEFKAKPQHDKTRGLLLTQELEANLSFYCESQREVDRLIDEVQLLRTQLLHQQMEINLERSIIQDFAKSQHLEVELIDITIAQLQPRLQNTIPNAA
ncbi:hypothetical protein DXT99_04930 [Pontibacter diazotrophicus]|uniref:Uncharacterized protein n=1 Tax=Pontibacter diazotrophicus TaxID=1400979 RepID=A0A3D8LGF1_9BACT|nr:hypothetical protein [Pontibacter diazotrophicus]RDV16539.1 hypothetical protein DXT99_04930 [Pontibacter diazotrophicus]